jgi:hypothetical protein
VLDQSSGRPLAGIVVSLAVSDGGRAHLPVGTLCSDGTGYVSFDLGPLISGGVDQVAALLVSAPAVGIQDRDLIAALSGPDGDGAEPDTTGDGAPETASRALSLSSVFVRADNPEPMDGEALAVAFPIYVEDAIAAPLGCAVPELPAVQAPDRIDYELSPYSFVAPMPSTFGADCCESLGPTTLPVQDHGFHKVVVYRPAPAADDGDEAQPWLASLLRRDRKVQPSGLKKPIDVGALPEPTDTSMKFAVVLEYRQRWYALGHALGQIQYSLPLAPGEATQLAVIDWVRQDSATRTDTVSATEALSHDLHRDRGIEDSIDAGLTESQGGWSWTGGLSSGMNYDTKLYGQYTGNWAAGGATSNTWGQRDVTGDAMQDLHDHIVQATSYVRSLNSTVVVQATQGEQNLVQTRRVANHNHSHALTIQYYEVLRHFRVHTSFVRRRNAVLLPFAPLVFTADVALRFRTILEQALLDKRLTNCFDALVRRAIGADAYGDESSEDDGPDDDAPPPSNYYTGTTTGIVVDSQTTGVDTGLLIQKGATVTATATSEAGIKFAQGSIDAFGPQGMQTIAQLPFPGPGKHAGAVLAQIGGDIYEIGIGATFKAENDGRLRLLFNDYSTWDNKGTASVDVTVTAPAPEPVAPDLTKTTPTAAAVSERNDRICEQRLLRHLQGNFGYYNRAVWMLMDPTERRMHLEAALGDDNDLLAGIDDTPIAVSGNHVAFPYNGPNLEIGFDEEDPEALEAIVTLPTRGLFAEAQLGHCNASELRDVTRNTDWTEMTTEEPPTISGIEPGPQGQLPNLTPSALPANVIQITQPQEAPDPTGLADALKLLGTANAFRDQSGLAQASAILGKLVDGTVSTLGGMKAAAKEAKDKVDAERAKGAAADGKNGSGAKKQTPKERYDNLQVAKQLADAQQDLGLTDEQTAALVGDILGDDGSGGGSTDGLLQLVSDQGAGVSKATEVALDLGTDVVKRVVDGFFDDKDVQIDLLKDGAVVLGSYKDPADYLGPSGALYNGLAMTVQLENLGGGAQLDGLYAKLDITWDDAYRLDPDRLKPEDKGRKAILQTVWTKQNILVTPDEGRVGQAVKSAKVKLDLIADKMPTPWRGKTGTLYNVENTATLLISVNVQRNFGGGALVKTVKVPITISNGWNQSLIRVVNNANQNGFNVVYPPPPEALPITTM